MRCGEVERARRLVAHNKTTVAEALGPVETLSVHDAASPVSIAWVKVDPSLVERLDQIGEFGLEVLPGGPFYWESCNRGNNMIRLALMRDADVVEQAVSRLSAWANTYQLTRKV